jgi:hypothetical protein
MRALLVAGAGPVGPADEDTSAAEETADETHDEG